jgi:catechol 2,3-dioxygenase-like lactoylglutathione lyase family enzyme
MGGGVAIGYTLQNPGQVTGLALMGPGGLGDKIQNQLLSWAFVKVPGALLSLTWYIITEDVPLLTRFYEKVLQVKADGDEIHMMFVIGAEGLAIYSKTAAEKDMAFDFSTHWGAGNFTIGFNVDDVGKEYQRLQLLQVDFVTVPTTYSWGARSVHFRDPDGNIICFRTIVKKEHSK